MITEDEAFWAGIAVATMMLGGGFSMLFLPNFTGFGSVVLAMGLLTMAITIQMRAKPIEQSFENMIPIESRMMLPTSIEPARDTSEIQSSSEQSETETRTQEASNHESTESKQPVEEHAEPSPAPAQPPEPAPTEPQSPPQPQAPPAENKTEPPQAEKPKEEPPIVLVEN